MPVARDLPQDFIESLSKRVFEGSPNELSRTHRDWEAIREVSSATMKPGTLAREYSFGSRPFIGEGDLRWPVEEVIRRRRSAQAYDGGTSIGAEALHRILDRTLPRSGLAPFDVQLGDTCLHLFLFVHRVRGLEPGLYVLVRDEAQTGALKAQCGRDFLWQRPEGTPENLQLYLLAKGDLRAHARLVSCHQDIAADGAFSLAMVGRFSEVVAGEPFRYRMLFWEAGMIGQVLYLEAEALGLRGTGIGCFFDDSVHEFLGIHGEDFQDLYHFTVGKPLEDQRIASWPAYHHLANATSSAPSPRPS